MLNIVVARYSEKASDVDWMKQLEKGTLFLYEKGEALEEDFVAGFSNCNVIQRHLPNIGRESHTYLTHIVDHWTDLEKSKDDVTLFTQAGIRAHISISSTTNEYIQAIAKEAAEKGFSESLARQHPECGPEHQPTPDFRIREWPLRSPLTPNPRDETFERWFERCLKQRFPPQSIYRWSMGAIFAVKNSTILQRGKAYYEALLAELTDTNPEIGHFFERSWYYIFKRAPEYWYDVPITAEKSVIDANASHTSCANAGPKILLLQIDTRLLPPAKCFAKEYIYPRGDSTDDIAPVKSEFMRQHGFDNLDNLDNLPQPALSRFRLQQNRRAHPRIQQQQQQQQQQQNLVPTNMPYYLLTSVMNKFQCNSNKHSNITYKYQTVEPIADRHPSWTKYHTLIADWADLKSFDVVIVIDTDAWIRDIDAFVRWINAFHAATDKSFLYSAETYCRYTVSNGEIQQPVNGGFTALKPNDFALEALKSIYDTPDVYPPYKEFKTQWTFEQICIGHKINTDPVFRDSIVIGPLGLFNTPAGRILCHCWWKELVEHMIVPEILMAIQNSQ